MHLTGCNDRGDRHPKSQRRRLPQRRRREDSLVATKAPEAALEEAGESRPAPSELPDLLSLTTPRSCGSKLNLSSRVGSL